MKHFTFVTLVASLAILFVAASPQDKQKKGVDQKKHMQVMEMMEDSSMMDMMMEHIASDSDMRMGMMHKMMSQVKSDTSSMMEMCKTMMDDKDMHSCMMKMMDGGMMNHDMMHGKSSDKKKDDAKKSDHEEHQK